MRFSFVQQIIQHLRYGVLQHLHAFNIVVIPFFQRGDAVALQRFLHIFLGIKLVIVFDDRVQHIPGVIFSGIAFADIIHPVSVCYVSRILTVFQHRFT